MDGIASWVVAAGDQVQAPTDLQGLFIGLAALVTAIFSGVIGLIAAVRGGRRVQGNAAEEAASRALDPDDELGEDAILQRAERIRLERERRARERGEP